MRRKPITILVRKIAGGVGRWEHWGSYRDVIAAETEFRARIQGRGVTAWTWIGPTPEAKKMLADPSYRPPEECRQAPSENTGP